MIVAAMSSALCMLPDSSLASITSSAVSGSSSASTGQADLFEPNLRHCSSEGLFKRRPHSQHHCCSAHRGRRCLQHGVGTQRAQMSLVYAGTGSERCPPMQANARHVCTSILMPAAAAAPPTSEPLDLAGPRRLVKALRVTLLTHLRMIERRIAGHTEAESEYLASHSLLGCRPSAHQPAPRWECACSTPQSHHLPCEHARFPCSIPACHSQGSCRAVWAWGAVKYVKGKHAKWP